MSEQTPRIIEGLTPKPAPLARMRASEREATPAPPPAEAAVEAPASKSGTKTPRRAPRKASSTVTSGKRSMSFYAHESTHKRARAAYRHTRHLEGDESYSDMVEKALEAEVARREAAYNGGKPFEGTDTPLPAGRPMQG